MKKERVNHSQVLQKYPNTYSFLKEKKIQRIEKGRLSKLFIDWKEGEYYSNFVSEQMARDYFDKNQEFIDARLLLSGKYNGQNLLYGVENLKLKRKRIKIISKRFGPEDYINK